ncbi:MAG: beta-glucosidase BglX [Balneola sp.]|nr:MAG: beta-glucosidase BglX [Balneola sp.]
MAVKANPEKTEEHIDIASAVNDLLSKMTLEEKIGQMNQYSSTWDITGPMPEGVDEQERYQKITEGKVGSMLNVVGVDATRKAQRLAIEHSRLGIPLIFGYDVIHGYKTMFPIPLAESCSWDLELIEKSARIAATESAASGVHWTFAPMMDIGRDARWGRVIEGGGEDTHLGTKIAVARVKGFQGNDLSRKDTIAATAKHFAGYGFIVGGRDYNTTELNTNTLYNHVLPPFKASVEAGVATVMNSFNDIDGIPVTGNTHLQRRILKEDWGFEGFIITDWNTIGEMKKHQYAKDLREASKRAILAGADMDMESQGFEFFLKEIVESGEVDESFVDEAVRRILTLKFKLGLFDDPYKYCDEHLEKTKVFCKEHRDASKEAALKSIVLLKNEKNQLPLSKEAKSIAVIGSLADDKDTPIGTWRAQAIPFSAVSLLEGIQNKVSDDVEVRFSKGYTLSTGIPEFTQTLDLSNADDRSGFDDAIELAAASDMVILALGEECFQSGEGRSQTEIGLKGSQLDLLKEINKVNKNVIVVLINGRPIAEPWLYENMSTILECWQLGSESGNAIADVLFGDFNPSGKLAISIPRNVGQVPIYYNRNNTGRPINDDIDPLYVFWSHYIDSEKTPQYSFGHGLSYTTFEYSNLELSSQTMKMDERIFVSVEVKNIGNMKGTETVQFYINDLYSSTIRPIKELKGFTKIELEPGKSNRVVFEITWETLAFYGPDRTLAAEPGEFEIMIGGNSEELLTQKIELI